MTAADLAAVLLAVVVVGVAVTFSVVVASLLRTVRELTSQLARVEHEVVPLVGELRDTVAAAGHEVERVDRLLESAEAISATVEGASRLGYAAFTRPVIRTVAVVQGTGRGLRRVTGRTGRVRRAERRATRTGRVPAGARSSTLVSRRAV